jgi:heat shock protein HslJ
MKIWCVRLIVFVNEAMMKNVIKIIALSFLFTACSSTEQKREEKFQLKGAWKVVKIGDEKVPSELMFTLNVDSTLKVNGKSACNSYFGQVTVKNDSLNFGALGTTRMLCEELNNKWEMKYLSSLQNSLKITSSGVDNFSLSNPTTVIEFEKNRPISRGK